WTEIQVRVGGNRREILRVPGQPAARAGSFPQPRAGPAPLRRKCGNVQHTGTWTPEPACAAGAPPARRRPGTMNPEPGTQNWPQPPPLVHTTLAHANSESQKRRE